MIGVTKVSIWFRSLFPETFGCNVEVAQIEEVMTEARMLSNSRHPYPATKEDVQALDSSLEQEIQNT